MSRWQKGGRLEEEEGGTVGPNAEPRRKGDTRPSFQELPFIIGRMSFFDSFGHNFHKTLYIERNQLFKSNDVLVNYAGVSEVKQSRSESGFNCS